jgi:hypothetical protein
MASSGSLNTSNYGGRYLTFAWSIKNSQADRIETNKTTIAWTLKGAGTANVGYYEAGNFKVKLNGTTIFAQTKRIELWDGTSVASGEYTFTHNTDGTKDFAVYVEAGIYLVAVNCTGETTFTIDTIPRASTLTASNGTLGQSQTLTINRASDTFKHRLTYTCGDVSGYIVGSATGYSTGTSIAWTPPLGLAAENPEGTSVSVKLTLYTYTSDGSHVGTTTKTITCSIPSSVAPSCTIAWEDTTGHNATYGAPVQGLSTLKITVTGKTSQSSPIASYAITANGVKYTSQEVTTGVLRAAGANTITATVTDERGRSGSASVTLDVLEYSAPNVSALTVHRCDASGNEDEEGEYVKATFSAKVSSLDSKNTATYKLRYKKTVDSTYTEVTLATLANQYTVTDYGYVFQASGNESYDVEVVATDKHSSHTRATTVSTAFTLMNFHPSGTGIGIGKVSEHEKRVEFGLPVEFDRAVFGKVYGLGELPAIPEGADLNSYLDSGVYSIRTDSAAKTLQNGPPLKEAGRLIVSGSTGAWEGDGAKWKYIEQRFVPYLYGKLSADRPAYLRYITQPGTDTLTYHPWFNEALKTMPVGTIIHRYDHQDPAELFGGSWTRVSSYILRGATASGTIGETGTLADGSGRSYINVSIWRRTA